MEAEKGTEMPLRLPLGMVRYQVFARPLVYGHNRMLARPYTLWEVLPDVKSTTITTTTT